MPHLSFCWTPKTTSWYLSIIHQSWQGLLKDFKHQCGHDTGPRNPYIYMQCKTLYTCIWQIKSSYLEFIQLKKMRPSQITIFHYVTKSSNKIRELTTTTKKEVKEINQNFKEICTAGNPQNWLLYVESSLFVISRFQ